MSEANSRRTLLTIICEAGLESSVVGDLAAFGSHGYTITEARGSGTRGPRDAAWPPSANIRIEILCEGKIAAAIVEHLQVTYYANYGMICFLADVQVLRPSKF